MQSTISTDTIKQLNRAMKVRKHSLLEAAFRSGINVITLTKIARAAEPYPCYSGTRLAVETYIRTGGTV